VGLIGSGLNRKWAEKEVDNGIIELKKEMGQKRKRTGLKWAKKKNWLKQNCFFSKRSSVLKYLYKRRCGPNNKWAKEKVS